MPRSRARPDPAPDPGVEDGECLDLEHGQIQTLTRTQTQWALPRCGGARPDPNPNLDQDPDSDPDPGPVGNTSMLRSKAFRV